MFRSNLRFPTFPLFVAALTVFVAAGCRSSFWPGNYSEPNSLANVRTIAGLNREFGEPFGIAVRDGEIFVSDGEKGTISRIADGTVSVFVSGLKTPSAITFTSSGDLLVAETGSHTIKRIDSSGAISIIAGVEDQHGFSDGPAPTALFNGPIGIAVTSSGTIFVSDTYNDRIRMIENGQVSTIAGRDRGFSDGSRSEAKFDTPLGISVWNSNKILVADSANRRIRVIEPHGQTWTLAGTGDGSLIDGPLSIASFVAPTAVAVGANNSVLIADGNSVRALGLRTFPIVETLSSERRGVEDGARRGARFNRPSGIAAGTDGSVLVADSDNQLLRAITGLETGKEISPEEKTKLRYSAQEFRTLQPARWPYDPPEAKREIAGTLAEVRGEITNKETSAWFHNGLDIAGGYGETARFVRSETVLDPSAVQNFATSRELIRMPTMGYIHIRIGRYSYDRPFDDERFQFIRDSSTKTIGVRVPRGTKFSAGEPIGTLNALNHVHLIAGRNGAEMNALDALILPGVSDSIAPVIENAAIYDENWRQIETQSTAKRITQGKVRLVAKAYDRVDGNAERRRLGVYRIGYQLLDSNGSPVIEPVWTIQFDRMPANDAVEFVYAIGSRSGATGETIFNYIVSNKVNGDGYREGFIDIAGLPAGMYKLRVLAADFFGNTSNKDIDIEVIR